MRRVRPAMVLSIRKLPEKDEDASTELIKWLSDEFPLPTKSGRNGTLELYSSPKAEFPFTEAKPGAYVFFEENGPGVGTITSQSMGELKELPEPGIFFAKSGDKRLLKMSDGISVAIAEVDREDVEALISQLTETLENWEGGQDDKESPS